MIEWIFSWIALALTLTAGLGGFVYICMMIGDAFLWWINREE